MGVNEWVHASIHVLVVTCRDSPVGRASSWKARHNTDEGLSSQDSKEFFSQSTSSADSYLTVSVQPVCEIACISICVHIKNPKHWQPHHCLDTQKILHTLIGMGSAAFAAAVPYPGKVTRISHEGQWSAKKYILVIWLISQISDQPQSKRLSGLLWCVLDLDEQFSLY